MKDRLWFVTDGDDPVDCFLTKAAAMNCMNSYRNVDGFEYFDVYSVELDEIDYYPDERDLAEEKEYI